ncbi:hypothetical protein RIVM261_081840 [Rivularia sp. IAM M-261]|nr:hypothetical protein CAL7716_098270 [Calothrix sp. PCC 7716]GJD23228.1 hypothetical protein RIVM261_081840 [Rivularia sp. IAM M-261]
MKNRLIIDNLSYLDSLVDTNKIIAGQAQAATFTLTTVGNGHATSGAAAIALGNTTSTNTQTLARVLFYGDVNISLADARARGIATTGSNIAASSSLSTSTCISFTSSNNFVTQVG